MSQKESKDVKKSQEETSGVKRRKEELRRLKKLNRSGKIMEGMRIQNESQMINSSR